MVVSDMKIFGNVATTGGMRGHKCLIINRVESEVFRPLGGGKTGIINDLGWNL